MKKVQLTGTILFGLGILLVCGTGIDLTYSRTGTGMMVLAVSGLLIVLAGRRAKNLPSRSAPVFAVIIGAIYFVWRALSGGPPAFAVADSALVALLMASYLLIVRGGKGGPAMVVGFLGLACIVNIGFSIIQWTSGEQRFVWREPFGKGQVVSGLFGHYNYFAAFLNSLVFIFLSLVFFTKERIIRVLSAILALASVGCLIASGSRGGWVAFVVGLVVWVILALLDLKARKHPWFGVSALLGVLVLVAAAVTAVPVVQKLTDRRGEARQEAAGDDKKVETEISDGGRIYFQQLAFEIFQDSPMTGSGPRSFSYLALEHWDTEEHAVWNANPVFAHNEFMQVLADYGLIGFLIVVLCLFGLGVVSVISLAIRDGRNERWLVAVQIGALSGLAAMVGQSFFSFLAHIPVCVMMIGLLLGFLTLGGGPQQEREGRVKGLVVTVTLLATSAGLGFLGWRFHQSYSGFEKAKADLDRSVDRKSAIRVLESLKQAGLVGYNPEILESSGRLAGRLSTKAFDEGNRKEGMEFSQIALDHFQEVQKLNPHSSVALIMIPHVLDSLGKFEEADAGFGLAMERLGVREYSLKPHLYAAKSKFGRARMDLDRGRNQKALMSFVLALEYLAQRREILDYFPELPEDKAFRLEIESRIALLEGEILYREGDRVWKEARPRKPELAYALMLAAAERYQASAKILEEEPGSKWAAQWNQLEKNLDLLKRVGTKPVSLTKEQISEVINREAGLDPDAVKR